MIPCGNAGRGRKAENRFLPASLVAPDCWRQIGRVTVAWHDQMSELVLSHAPRVVLVDQLLRLRVDSDVDYEGLCRLGRIPVPAQVPGVYAIVDQLQQGFGPVQVTPGTQDHVLRRWSALRVEVAKILWYPERKLLDQFGAETLGRRLGQFVLRHQLIERLILY